MFVTTYPTPYTDIVSKKKRRDEVRIFKYMNLAMRCFMIRFDIVPCPRHVLILNRFIKPFMNR